MRKTIIAGNWKMHKTPSSALSFVETFSDLEIYDHVRVIICAPYLALESLVQNANAPLEVSAQNLHQEEEGAYTGEISASMLTSIGVGITLIGHSERRQYFNETDSIVGKKLQQALAHNMEAIVCVGEQLSEREADQHEFVVSSQLKEALKDVSSSQMDRICIAYEPVWAIGTGKTASSSDAQAMSHHIRRILVDLFDDETASRCSILYGGSVKPDNIDELLMEPDVDGVLVGGASLDPVSFRSLVKAGNKK